MEIILDLAASSEGRLSGTVARVGRGDALSFSGTLELFARLEQLLHDHSESHPDRPSQGAEHD
jgi:hypothetical protein